MAQQKDAQHGEQSAAIEEEDRRLAKDDAVEHRRAVRKAKEPSGCESQQGKEAEFYDKLYADPIRQGSSQDVQHFAETSPAGAG
jgi:hypothetical protein